MNSWILIKRSLRFYWRTHLGVLLGVFTAGAVLVGALGVGDSVRATLKHLALARLGRTEFALEARDRFFRSDLAAGVERKIRTSVAPVLLLRGSVSNEDGSARVNNVQVVGVDERCWRMGGTEPLGLPQGAALNEHLALKLGAKEGETVLLRVEKPGLLPREAPLSGEEDTVTARRLSVEAILTDARFGRFSLRANQIPPSTVFLPLRRLSSLIGKEGRANTLLVALRSGEPLTLKELARSLKDSWSLDDAELEVRAIESQGEVELRTSRIFLEPPVVAAARRAGPGAVGIMTYLVNELRVRDRATPYSLVSAVGPLSQGAKLPLLSLVPPSMAENEIVVNRWLADDLSASVGDEIELTYYVVGPFRKLKEVKSVFKIRSVVPISGAALDPDLMPPFPGLAGEEDCRAWKPGVPIDLDRIRDKDEEYWDRWRGTPKAFVTLAAGRKMWHNRFGDLTAVRYSADSVTVRSVTESLLRDLDPAEIGLFFQPVRRLALEAASQALDFGQLFLGLSFFLLAASLLLVALLFVFGVEQRSEEIGTLLALGLRAKRIRRFLLAEGAVIALVGGALGVGGGFLYTKIVLWALGTVWRGAVGTSSLVFSVSSSTLIEGWAATFVIAVCAIALSLRKQVAKPARVLLARGAEFESSGGTESASGGWSLRIGLSAVAAAIGLVVLSTLVPRRIQTGLFFGSGALLLLGGIFLIRSLLSLTARRIAGSRLTLPSLALRNATRRTGRSLAVASLLACGTFLIVAVGANRRDPFRDASDRSSGTGGFALFADSTVPIYEDLNIESGRKAYNLDDRALEGVRFVPLRVRDGDDASCLNMNRARRPRLLGVNPEEFKSRGAFTFVRAAPGADPQAGWDLLRSEEGKDVVPAVGDEATVTWGLRMSVGDVLDYTDGRGRPFKVKIVGVIARSVFQGSLLISESRFIERFPSESGYRMFLIDVPGSPDRAKEVARLLARTFRREGLALVAAAERLGSFDIVENTYLSIFEALGGLGLVLGSVGLAVVVLRNVFERRNELALLQAVGFMKGRLSALVVYEHFFLVLSGVACGTVSALIAVAPSLGSSAVSVDYPLLAGLIAAVAASGLLWTWAAAYQALRGPLIQALRNE